MRDVSKLLAGTALESGKKERSYDGFDISPDQFPSTLEHPFRFHVQNILQPFPLEHHNQYDLVQVRFLTAALRADQVRTAVENVLPLLSTQPHHIKLTLPSSLALLRISDIFQHQTDDVQSREATSNGSRSSSPHPSISTICRPLLQKSSPLRSISCTTLLCMLVLASIYLNF